MAANCSGNLIHSSYNCISYIMKKPHVIHQVNVIVISQMDVISAAVRSYVQQISVNYISHDIVRVVQKEKHWLVKPRYLTQIWFSFYWKKYHIWYTNHFNIKSSLLRLIKWLLCLILWNTNTLINSILCIVNSCRYKSSSNLNS